MRKKGLKALSLALTASVLLSSAGTGTSVCAAGADSNVAESLEKHTISKELSATESGEADRQEEVVTGEITPEQVTKDQTATQQVTAQDASEQEITTAGQQENTEEQEEELDTKLEATDSDLVSSVITDQNLLKAVLDAYNAGNSSSVTASEFTYAMLRGYTGALDLSTVTAVTVIPQEAFYKCKFTSVKLPASIQNIENRAFKDCTGLTEITFPDGLKVLGAEAFSGCTSLAAINSTTVKDTLPKELEQVGQSVFLDAAELTQITIPNFSKGDILTNASGLFSGCVKLKSITIGKEITQLPMSAFSGAGVQSDTGVSVTFESDSKLDKILKGAFSGIKLNPDKAEIDLSDCSHLTKVSDDAFASVENLSTVILPESIVVNGEKGTLELGINTFANTTLKELYAKGHEVKGQIYLPDYIIGIGNGCFYGNTTMTSVSLPAQLPAIPDYTFDGCTALVNVEQRQSAGTCQVKAIGDCAFRNTAIENTEFLMKMNQLETIGYQKVEDTYGVGEKSRNLELIASIAEGGVGVTEVDSNTHQKSSSDNKPCGSEVFTGCKNLTSVTIPASVKTIGTRAFYFARSGDLSANSQPQAIKTDSRITTVIWESSTDKTQSVERRICSEAFHGNINLEKVILPENKNAKESLYIDPYAFYENVKLKTLATTDNSNNNILPSTLKGLGKGAFYWCADLENITISSSENGECPELGDAAFEKCIKLSVITLPESITKIPKRFCYDAPIAAFNTGAAVTVIEEFAFMGNQIEVLDLSKYTALAEIGVGAFAYADAYSDSKQVYNTYNWTVNGQESVMTTVILPNKLENLFMNSGIFLSQEKLTTVKTPNKGTDNQVYIPDYMPETGQGIFYDTGVSKVIWEADTTGQNQWTTIPEMMYCLCSGIQKAEDVLPSGNYVENIGKQAFYGSSVQSADLSKYTSLKQIGSGSIKNTAASGAFALCTGLTEVKLPDSEVTIGERTFYCDEALVRIDLGTATQVDKEAFYKCNGLKSIVFPESLKVIGEGAFKYCQELQKVDFGSVEDIKKEAFLNCEALVLTDYGLPDTLESIGNNAFKNATSLGKVTFGSKLTTIDSSAFEASGLTAVDFTKAVNLTTIKSSAFKQTKLTTFELKNTKVTTVNDILKGCTELISAEFGDGVKYIAKDALAGCPKFKNLTFSATTTVDTQVFYSQVSVDGKQQTTATDNDLAKGKVHITVNTPKETVVPLGREFDFPYEVTATPSAGKNAASQFEYALIGFENSSEDVDQYVKISAFLRDGYFKQQQSNTDDKYKVTSEEYYEALAASPTRKVKDRGSVKSVDTILMTGLKPTNGTVDFTLGCTIKFECADKEMPVIETESFTATYHLNIKEISLYADLYSDKERTIPFETNQAESIQAVSTSNKGSLHYYYRMNSADASLLPDTYNVVVETDNPDVLYPSSGNGGTKQASYTTAATQTDSSTGAVTEKSSGSYSHFWLVPTGVGTANIKVYPEGFPQYARTYTYNVNSDINSITLAIPGTYSGGTNPGDTFNVFSGLKNYFDQNATADDIADYSSFTNQTLSFESSDPDYAKVDNQGNVTILKADRSAKSIKITATAKNSAAGKEVSRSISVRIKAATTKPSTTEDGTTESPKTEEGTTIPPKTEEGTTESPKTEEGISSTVKVNESVQDSTTGATVTVIKTSENGTEGEVTYVQAGKSTSQVTIPEMITISGKKYRVTEIAENAFSGNATINKVIIPDSVTKINSKAFYNCRNLKTIAFSSRSGLTEIGESAFWNCSSLTKVTIPVNVTRIAKNAFKGCSKLKTVSVPAKSNLKEIGSGAFYNCKVLTKFTVPKKVTTIGANAFYNCKKLKTITIKSTVLKKAGKNAFKNIYKKATIKVPKSKLKAYKSLLKGKGQKKTVKIKK